MPVGVMPHITTIDSFFLFTALAVIASNGVIHGVSRDCQRFIRGSQRCVRNKIVC